ncbi:hypothetical protein CNMCM5793_009093 [Aspergillus hiratsukae]|uniref:Uncharacterized protein n=1 Tax=Aspergillus hiratsukae TaxID=1194566 RepID=A0A8H6PXS2_9EURO|nr:hypothetical protein CNMCM5793_009093 [Aspergillus hiratsukae]KAF7163216.1 hypothetical protein CNMCM6106_000204 [Aspergillus hiratsukae]
MAEINVALLVSPAAPATAKGKTKGRKTTPSPEAVSASKSIILGTFPSTDNVVRIQDSPVLARCGQIFPSGQAFIERRFPIKTSHAHPDPPVCEAQIPEAPPVRHLILPFNLKDDRGAFFNQDNDKLWAAVPTPLKRQLWIEET